MQDRIKEVIRENYNSLEEWREEKSKEDYNEKLKRDNRKHKDKIRWDEEMKVHLKNIEWRNGLSEKEKEIIREKRRNNCDYKKNQQYIQKKRAEILGIGIDEFIGLTKDCMLCGWKYNINIHHLIPTRLGGLNNFSNYVGLCSNCHKLIHTIKFGKVLTKFALELKHRK